MLMILFQPPLTTVQTTGGTAAATTGVTLYPRSKPPKKDTPKKRTTPKKNKKSTPKKTPDSGRRVKHTRKKSTPRAAGRPSNENEGALVGVLCVVYNGLQRAI